MRKHRCTAAAAGMALAFATLLTSSGCSNSTNPTVTVEPKFSSIQANIFNLNCTTSSCHGATGNRGGMILEGAVAYNNLVGVVPENDSAKARHLLRVFPGKPDSSFIIYKLTGPRSGEGDPMPKTGSSLDPQQIDAIRTWIANGAKND
ncbi:MAG TPA: hypothetical protein VHI13_12880 [Candidatus Kapabacteria bacterium]|nr:hypothetical protein [Candidatus Kapabacteria bacterium]